MGPRRTRVKICGITRSEDALAACAAGADAIGLVFYAASPRAVSIETAAQICKVLPPFVSAVGLFVNAGADEIAAVVRAVPLALLQLHGDETPEFCAQLRHPYLKALRMREDTDVLAAQARYPDARALLLDTYSPDLWGGTGKVFDWARIPAAARGRIVLAGGLNPDNVAAAIAQVRPYAVDVSGGVEAAPGIKDERHMRDFVAAVKRADSLEQSSD
jgi:phosphoribosylanthranilate isomerase